ncbi:hypothetical protein [Streptomyces microflavus]|uniref:hypothetical protein n=1 Tax=Streptomyces microflavus TaxID=1919 RepID=UPI0036D1DC69
MADTDNGANQADDGGRTGQYADVLPTWALLTLEGRWIEGGTHEYRAAFNAYRDELPDATVLVRVLYHS